MVRLKEEQQPVARVAELVLRLLGGCRDHASSFTKRAKKGERRGNGKSRRAKQITEQEPSTK